MGADKSLLPNKSDFIDMLKNQFSLPIKEKRSYCLIWELEGQAISHSNTNPTTFGKDAYMHLHICNERNRRKGLGKEYMELTIPLFFKNLQLEDLYAQPMSSNPPPNILLESLGFELVKTYITTPGSINFEQEVNLWRKTKA
ncbi:MAG: GNAT family N-acetyltransferase [Crocinitomicaceae bacterium]|nr:GNAT family N-acetyltransferase [Crocinitomicaceae bacterium]